jgi:hypothetical protein
MPFDVCVGGLSHCWDNSCAIKAAIQKHDMQDSTFRCVVGINPLLGAIAMVQKLWPLIRQFRRENGPERQAASDCLLNKAA